MRIERVIARAFGPFQGKTLELAPGMTVVAGPNESGKSSWHAALRLAITGVRRGKGPGTAAERQLVERHRPWDLPDRWEVEARLALDDGRTIDISQDLGAKVACRAVDVKMGRDVSDEIMDGTPDASRWLGLDRDSFAATVSVNQAQILAVADAADELQEQMQRAAATRGTDATAAEAIARLEQFRRDAIGADTVAAKGPLRAAKNRVAATTAALLEAQQLHSDYLERGAGLDEAERQADAAQLLLGGAEAAHARMQAAEAAARAARAAELAARHTTAPASSAARDELADRVAAALAAWASRPEPVTLAGRPSADIRHEIATLPPVPAGDTRPHPGVLEAQQAAAVAADSIRQHGDRPARPESVADGWDPARVRDLARQLRMPQSPPPAAIEAELARLQDRATSPRGDAAVSVAATAIGLLAAAILFFVGQTAIAAAILVGALVAGAWTLVRLARPPVARATEAGETALGSYRRAAAESALARAEAERAVLDGGLPADPVQLDELADRMVHAAQQAAAREDWDHRLASLRSRQLASSEALIRSLRERGEDVAEDADALAASAAYVLACEARDGQRQLADRAELLRVELTAREAAEAASVGVETRLANIVDALGAVAVQLGLDSDVEADRLAASLEGWRVERSAALQANQLALAEWQQLQALLDGGTLADLEAEAARRRQRATELAAALPPGAVSLPNVGDPEAYVAELRADAQRLRGEYDVAAGNLTARRDALADVAEAEEAAITARMELERVQALATTVDATLVLLRAAEERVHRDLAPILAQAAARWLPVVSRGAYSEISVDPADLNVRVKEAASGQWRRARLLSEGTREQIYLLLRVAMAQHLVTTGERAPLLLDEVTAQSDGDRKREMLDVLHQLSAERQVILFTHDDEVLQWAGRVLQQPRDAIVRLDPLVPPIQAAAVADGEVALAPVAMAD